jgi:hypothetical protein
MRKLSSLLRCRSRIVFGSFLCMSVASAQQPDLRLVLERLDRLEALNQELREELRSLRDQLGASAQSAPPQTGLNQSGATQPIQEQLEVQDRRIAELDQVKVGSDHRLPVTLTGTVLFNAYLNGQASGGSQNPVTASATTRRVGAGATLRQTILGLKFDGPTIFASGRISGAAYMDFFGGGTGLDQFFRLRTARLDADWKNTSVTFAFDKPLVAQRDPDSLAQVGLSPLTGAGNLWLWQPQVRVERRLGFGEQSGMRAQFSVYQTAEAGTGLSPDYGDSLAVSRPGYEGRFEFWGRHGDSQRIEIAPGFHASSTRVLGQSVPSRIFTLDWLIRPASRVDLTGTFFQGQNVGVIGGLRQGVSVYRDRLPSAVDSIGGWAQLKVRLTPRLSWNAFGGQEDDRNRQLDPGRIAKNQSYGTNLMYRWGSNVITSMEAAQVRTTYLGSGTRVNPHYDLAIGYLF